jgi:hypothetical protein
MKYSIVHERGPYKKEDRVALSGHKGKTPVCQALIGNAAIHNRRSYCAVNNGYLWKSDEHLNRIAKIRYEHGGELTDLPGVTGLGIGKDHIIAYVASDDVSVPAMIEDVHVIKVRRP